MFECKVDYLTLSIIPKEKIENVFGFYDFLLSFFGLSEYAYDFIGGRCPHYETKFSYNNIIHIKCPSSARSKKQGFLVEFTGQGIDFYIEHMRKKYPNFDEKNLLSAFFSLAETDFYKCKVTRYDQAVDDISYEKKSSYSLNFDLIKRALKAGEIVSPFHLRKSVHKMEVTFYESGRSTLDIQGETIYLGSRKGTHIRFYDKIAEMKSHKKAYDEKIQHWNRMEMQFMGNNAMAIATKRVSSTPDEFNQYFAECVNDYIRFIDVTENNVTNYHRCKSKKWWSDFIGTVEQSKLVHRKPIKNQCLSSLNWWKNSVAVTYYMLLQCFPEEYLYNEMMDSVSEHHNKRHDLIVDHYKNMDNFNVEDFKGLKYFGLYTSNPKEYLKFRRELKKACIENTKERIKQSIQAGKYKNDIPFAS